MALPVSGKISLGDVRTELKLTGPISLGQKEVRNLAGKTSGVIKMSDLRGKSAATWVKVGNIQANGRGWDIEESIYSCEYQFNNLIKSRYGVDIWAIFNMGTEVYSADKLAKAITVYTNQYPHGDREVAEMTVDVYKFQ